MKLRYVLDCLFPLALLCGCGGSDGEFDNSTIDPGTGVRYGFAEPRVDSSTTYNYTVADNLGNGMGMQVTHVINQANPDGTYVVLESPAFSTGFGDLRLAAGYTWVARSMSLDRSGRMTSFGYASGTKLMVCSQSPSQGGPMYPLAVGQRWVMSFQTCDPPGTSHAASGVVAALESVTVPAGSFQALRLESVVVSTPPAGRPDLAIRTETATTWRDVRTSMVVREVIRIAYSGVAATNGCAPSAEGWLSMGVAYSAAPPAIGCPVSTTAELASFTP